MASFAAQLMDMFFGLVERVTGYGGSAVDKQDAAGAQKLTKLAFDASQIEEVIPVQNIQIRARGGDPIVQGGSMPQINSVGI